MAEVVIIGGGAAGMAAALEAAQKGDKVLVLERMDRVGKKLLATGNGRCNLMNTEGARYPGGKAFADAVLAHCGVEEQREFWRNLGLNLRTEEAGRVYPVSGQASSVLDTLRLAMDAADITVKTGMHVQNIKTTRHGFAVQAGDESFRADRVIVAGGGCAQPKLGSDGSCYELLASLGHRVVKPQPCLTQIVTDTAALKGLAGIRVKCRVSIVRKDKEIHAENGEALFADYGMSGVCVMQCARYAQAGSLLVLDMTQGLGYENESELAEELYRRKTQWQNRPMEQILTGLCVPRLAAALCLQAGIQWKNRLLGSLTKAEIRELAGVIGAFELPIKGIKGFESAQVARGGVDWHDFDPYTLESKLVPGLHAAGEVLDVDGDCGGFNLMFAFACGMLAGRNGR